MKPQRSQSENRTHCNSRITLRSPRSLLRKEIKILNRRERRERGEFSGEKPLNISFFLFDSFSIILCELCGEYILAVFSSLDDLFMVYGNCGERF
ncbi:MAG: hypothetical protein V2B13_04560 [Pseudomonadota bacterium]